MAATWLTEFILLFRPEASPRIPGGKYAPVSVFQSKNEKIAISVKALVWTVISILFGLVVGQL